MGAGEGEVEGVCRCSCSCGRRRRRGDGGKGRRRGRGRGDVDDGAAAGEVPADTEKYGDAVSPDEVSADAGGGEVSLTAGRSALVVDIYSTTAYVVRNSELAGSPGKGRAVGFHACAWETVGVIRVMQDWDTLVLEWEVYSGFSVLESCRFSRTTINESIQLRVRFVRSGKSRPATESVESVLGEAVAKSGIYTS